MGWMDLELCTGDGCKNWPTRELVPPNVSSWVSWSVKHRLVSHPNCQQKILKNLIRTNWTVFMGWMDLELCTGDWCKNWSTRELVPPKISSWVSWSVKHRLVPHSKLLAQDKKTCLGTIRLCSCTEWILSFVQEMGVRTALQGSWFHQKSLPEFLDPWSIDWSHIPNC